MTPPTACIHRLSISHSIIRLGHKGTPIIFSFAASTNKCPQNDTKKDVRKSALFVVVGVLTILLGLVFFLDRELNLHDIYAILLFAIGIVVLLAGIYGVCFLYNIKLRRH
jgi:uncharacterized membrane protein HdeD (DUF308 family)